MGEEGDEGKRVKKNKEQRTKGYYPENSRAHSSCQRSSHSVRELWNCVMRQQTKAWSALYCTWNVLFRFFIIIHQL